MVSRFKSWLRGDDLNERMERLNAPLQLDVRQAAGDQIVRWERGKPGYTDKSVEAFDKEAYRRASLIYACVRYLSSAVGSVPVKVFRTLGNGQDEEDPDHALRQLMRQPNIGMGEGRFLSFITMSAAIAGYCVIEKERNAYGQVIALWPLRPDWLRPIPRSAGVVDWQYTVPGYAEPFIIEAEDAIAVPFSDVPTGDPLGIGPVEIIFRQAGITSSLASFISRFIENDAMPQYMLIPDTEGKLAAQWTKPETVDAFYAQFKQRYMGRGRERDIIVSPAIKDVKRLTMDMNELAYRDLRNVNDTDITTAFGIPPILLGTMIGLERSTYSNYEQARRAFWEDQVVPFLSRLDDVLTRGLMPEFFPVDGYDLRFDLGEVPALRDDENAAHERARQDFTSGLVSRHTAQRMAGIDPHGNDAFLLPFSAVEVPLNAPPKTDTTVTVEPVDEEDDERQIARLSESIRAIASALGGDGVDQLKALGWGESRFIVRDGRTYINERALSPEQRAASDRVATKNKEQIVRLAGLAEPVLTSFFQEQAERIVDVAVRGADGAPEVRAIEQIDWDEEDRLLRESMRQWWETVSQTAWADAGTLLQTDLMWSISNPHLATLFDVLGKRIPDINLTTRRDLEAIIRDALTEGTTMPDLASKIEHLFEQTYNGRASTVARTESMFAYSEASVRGYQASGVVNRVQIADNPDHTEEYKGAADGLTCAARNGLVVSLDRAMFHISSDHPNGTACLIPVLSTPLGEV